MSPHKSAIIGLGAMGMGMAQSAHAAGLQTVGMDINPAAMETLAATGATIAETPAKAAAGADSLTVGVVNAFNLIDGLNGLSSYVAISVAFMEKNAEYADKLEDFIKDKFVKLLILSK